MSRRDGIHPVVPCTGFGRGTGAPGDDDDAAPRRTVRQATQASGHGPTILAPEAQRFRVAGAIGGTGGRIILEPSPRATAAAVCIAALRLHARAPGTVMLVLPWDHAIEDGARLGPALTQAAAAAEAGGIVAFGLGGGRPARARDCIAPDRAAAGPDPAAIARFVEAPDPADAARGVAQGWLWYAGACLLRADRAIEAFRRHAPEVLEPCRRAMAAATHDPDFVRPDPAAYAAAAPISVERAVLAPAGGLVLALPAEDGQGATAAAEDRDPALGAAAPGSEGHAAPPCLPVEDGGVRLLGLGLDTLVAVANRGAVPPRPVSAPGEQSTAQAPVRRAPCGRRLKLRRTPGTAGAPRQGGQA